MTNFNDVSLLQSVVRWRLFGVSNIMLSPVFLNFQSTNSSTAVKITDYYVINTMTSWATFHATVCGNLLITQFKPITVYFKMLRIFILLRCAITGSVDISYIHKFDFKHIKISIYFITFNIKINIREIYILKTSYNAIIRTVHELCGQGS